MLDREDTVNFCLGPILKHHITIACSKGSAFINSKLRTSCIGCRAYSDSGTIVNSNLLLTSYTSCLILYFQLASGCDI